MPTASTRPRSRAWRSAMAVIASTQALPGVLARGRLLGGARRRRVSRSSNIATTRSSLVGKRRKTVACPTPARRAISSTQRSAPSSANSSDAAARISLPVAARVGAAAGLRHRLGDGLGGLDRRHVPAADEDRGERSTPTQHKPRADREGRLEAVDQRRGLIARRRVAAVRRAARRRSAELATVDRIARPSAPPICCEELKIPEARPASASVTLVVAISVSGTNVQPEAGRHHEQARQDVGDVGAVHRRPRQQQQPDGRRRTCRSSRSRARRSARSACWATPENRMIPAVSGRNARPVCTGREVERLLQVDRREVEDGEHASRHRQHREVRARQRADAEDAEPHQRRLRARARS